ncbi:MAG: hypothetical protein M3256_19950 [Actinomycetota bacterium]|nr:hypothetical protein [Actinomycetota bacterium]
MASEKRVHRLILPNNPTDAYAAIQAFAASLEETDEDEPVEKDDEK